MIEEMISAFESYNLWLIILGSAVLAVAILPRVLSKYPLSMPIVLLLMGYAAMVLPLGLQAPDPLRHGRIIEHLTEFGVIITLMGAGLKIDRPFSLRGWNSTWRLLGITMILTIGMVSLMGWWLAAFPLATAVLFGAVIAPTDPVLASEVQVGAPGEGIRNEGSASGREEAEIKFALTSEAGFNDGLAFPFTNLAILMALAGNNPANWIGAWLLVDVVYKLVVGTLVGIVMGRVLARIIIAVPKGKHLERSLMGLGALFSTLLIYGATEFVGGYGFIATFVGAVIIRSYERHHEYQKTMHAFSEAFERVITAVIVVAFGASLARGLLSPLTWPLVLCAVLIVFAVRPACGLVALAGCRMSWPERWAVSFFGIRGIGSLYYLSFALNQSQFPDQEALWALVALVVVVSIFTHGILAAPFIRFVDRRQRQQEAMTADPPVDLGDG